MQRQTFSDKRVHVVQVGMDTNQTFVQNLAGPASEWDASIDWLLGSISEDRHHRKEYITGIAVEPVQEHINALLPYAVNLPLVAFVQTALGDADDPGAKIHMVTKDTHDRIIEQVEQSKRSDVTTHLVYLRNMSCVGRVHPAWKMHNDWLHAMFGIEVGADEVPTGVWTLAKLASELELCGCELLILDTEGHDAKILRSMIDHCRDAKIVEAWPDVIQFETQGHCDAVEGPGTEWAVIKLLLSNGYLLVHYSHRNTQLIRKEAIRQGTSKKRLRRWSGWFVCAWCRRRGRFPYISTADHIICQRCICTYKKWQSARMRRVRSRAGAWVSSRAGSHAQGQ